MKILVTGGAGFIGSNIVDRYLALGHSVVVVDDLCNGCRDNVHPDARLIECSITSPTLRTIVAAERPDVINHHAAQIDVQTSMVDPIANAQVNIMGSLNLCEAARAARVKKIIFASSGGALYGEQEAFPATSTHPTNPQNPYGIGKLAVELYLHHYRWNCGIPSVIFRYANVYGPRQNAHGEGGVVAVFTDALLQGRTPIIHGDGTQTRDFVFVGDVVSCNVAALHSGVVGVQHVATGVETDLNTLTQLLVRLTGASAWPTHGPAKSGDQARSVLTPGALQCVVTSLAEGLSETVQWFTQQQQRPAKQ